MSISNDVKQKSFEVLSSTVLKVVEQIKSMFDWLNSEDLHSEAFYKLLAKQSIPLYVRWQLLKGNLSKFAEMSTYDETRQFTFAAFSYKSISQDQFQISPSALTEKSNRQGWSWETQIAIPAQKPTSFPQKDESMAIYGVVNFEAYLKDCDESFEDVDYLWLNQLFYQAISRFSYKELVNLLAQFIAIVTLAPKGELEKCFFKTDVAYYVRWELLGADFHKFIEMSSQLDVFTMNVAIFAHQNFRPLYREFASAYSAVKNNGLEERLADIKQLDSFSSKQLANS